MEEKEAATRFDDEQIIEIEIERLRSFKDHPFKVEDDKDMHLLKDSIKKYGVLNPLIVRPVPDGVYEIISGHRRKYAAQQLGYRKVPVIIRVMNDEEAIIKMVDSNLQRERISYSEKAFAWEAFLADDNGSREIEVTTTTTQRVLYVTLTNTNFDAVARANLTEEQEILYDALNTTLGNRDYLWDVNRITGAGGGMSYEIPPEALSDERFAGMIREAEKYLGYPYVWGGSSPSTSFDCSGFVSWVVNHCGNGWNYGRRTADGFVTFVLMFHRHRQSREITRSPAKKLRTW